MKAHLAWTPKYRKKVLTWEGALRVRDLVRQIAMEHDITILSGKVASDHIQVLAGLRPHVDVSVRAPESEAVLQPAEVDRGATVAGRLAPPEERPPRFELDRREAAAV